MSVFFISDLHFDHANIIRYCNRPFKDVREMNRTLIYNWNEVVGARDTVYHLGDFCKNHRNPYDFIKDMNGRIIFIKGNHDNALIDHKVRPLYDIRVIRYYRENFVLIHTPEWLTTPSHDTWCIHGHSHNNSPSLYPLVNNRNKTMNVSCELTNYIPVRANVLLSKRSN